MQILNTNVVSTARLRQFDSLNPVTTVVDRYSPSLLTKLDLLHQNDVMRLRGYALQNGFAPKHQFG